MEIQLKQTSERVYYMILNGAKQVFINSKGRTIAEYYDCSKNSDEKTEEYFYIPVVGYPYRLEAEGFRILYTKYDTKKIVETLIEAAQTAAGGYETETRHKDTGNIPS